MIKKINLKNIPKKTKNYDWRNSINREIEFNYNGIVGEIKIVNYITINKHPYLEVLYNNKKSKISTKSLVGCNLGCLVGEITSDFKIDNGSIIKHDNINIKIIDREYRKDYKGQMLKYYKYHCNKCGAELWISEYDLLKIKNCSVCINKIIIKGINDIATTHSYLLKYFVNKEDGYKYSYGSGKIIKAKCPDCGFEREYSISNLYTQGFSCKKCGYGISYSNKFMFNLLQQLNIEFITEYSPKWIKPKRYDFYIPSMKLIIEMDGGFHNKDNRMSGQTAEQSKEIDNYKDKLAKEHGLEVIRIDCDYKDILTRYNYIKENTIFKLKNIFDVNNINWDKCLKYCESNLILIASDIKNKNPNYTTSDIGKIMKYNNNTIGRWLKIGNELGMCKYNSNQESERIINENSIKNSKEVKMYKDGKYIDTFKNSSDLQKISQERFGVLLYACEINRVCNKRKNSYKGYYFEFVNDKPIDEIKYKKGKQVEVFKEGVSLGIYESCNELSRKSLDDFGVEFSISKISNVCNGKRKSHKGYTFKYI